MQPYVRRSTAVAATDQIRDAIISGDLAMGSPLSEATIAEQLGISRTPVREAMRQLAQEGLVQLRPYVGASVFVVTVQELAQMIDFREMLEVAALKQGMTRDAPGLGAKLQTIATQMEAAIHASDVRPYSALDTEFHDTIIDAAGSSFLHDAYTLVSSKLAAMRTVIWRDKDRLQRSIHGHEALIARISAGDVQAAIAVLIQHIRNAEMVFAGDKTLFGHTEN
ncbi:MAG: GntR family transcriptional regulator [Pseudomonadota bacterium]|jgi:DNA-binding GntR family transcriptional regulator